MSDAVHHFLNWIFSEDFSKRLNQGQKVVRVEACVFEYNQVSSKVLLKNDFKLESVQEKAYIKEGKLLDGHMYVRINKD